MDKENNLFDLIIEDKGKKYINSYNEEYQTEVNLIFEEDDTNVMENLLDMMIKIYVDDILKNCEK